MTTASLGIATGSCGRRLLQERIDLVLAHRNFRIGPQMGRDLPRPKLADVQPNRLQDRTFRYEPVAQLLPSVPSLPQGFLSEAADGQQSKTNLYCEEPHSVSGWLEC